MEDNAPLTPSTPEGNPVQDRPSSDTASLEKSSRVEVPEKDNPTIFAPDGAGPNKVSPPTRPRGPNASAIVVGLVALVFAGLIMARETLNWRVDWSRLGPAAIVGIGIVMAVIGAIGLIRRHDDL